MMGISFMKWWNSIFLCVTLELQSYPFKRQLHKMVKHTQTICRLLPTNCLSVFDHFAELALKGYTRFFGHSVVTKNLFHFVLLYHKATISMIQIELLEYGFCTYSFYDAIC